jgi:hypothetical protein
VRGVVWSVVNCEVVCRKQESKTSGSREVLHVERRDMQALAVYVDLSTFRTSPHP